MAELLGLVRELWEGVKGRFSGRAGAPLFVGLVFILAGGLLPRDDAVELSGVRLPDALVLLGVLMILAAVIAAIAPERRRVWAEAASRGGDVLIGIEVSRRWLRYGTVSVGTHDLFTLPSAEPHLELEAFEAVPLPMNAEKRSREIVDAIFRCCEKKGRVDGIGLGIPGQHNLREKRVVNPAFEGWPPGTFVDDLATALVDAPDVVHKALDVRGPPRPELIRQKMLIDNEVRCATRYILSTRRDEPDWRNFAILSVGENGVGSGLVIDGRVYYGSSDAAGEVGHVTIHLGDRIHDGPPGERTIGRCQCGKVGTHWESLISPPALVEIAQHVDRERYEALVTAAAHDGTPPATRLVDACVGAADEAARGAMPHAVRELVVDPDVKAFLEAALGRYAFYVAVGTAGMLNALNLDHVMMGGDVLGRLWGLPELRHPFNKHLFDYALPAAYRAELVDVPPTEAGWAGAALTFRDPTYEAAVSIPRMVEAPPS